VTSITSFYGYNNSHTLDGGHQYLKLGCCALITHNTNILGFSAISVYNAKAYQAMLLKLMLS
jgi:hypothetical protein